MSGRSGPLRQGIFSAQRQEGRETACSNNIGAVTGCLFAVLGKSFPRRYHGSRAFAVAMQRAGRGHCRSRLHAAWPFHVTLALPCPEPVLGVQLGEGSFAVVYLGSFCSFAVAVKTVSQSQADSSKEILHEHNVWTFSGGPRVFMELMAASLTGVRLYNGLMPCHVLAWRFWELWPTCILVTSYVKM